MLIEFKRTFVTPPDGPPAVIHHRANSIGVLPARTVLVLLAASLSALASIVLVGCSDKALGPAFQAYFDATSPEYVQYVTADTKLDAAQKARRIQCVESARRVLDEVHKAN